MCGVFAWVVEQLCRLGDPQVCALANLTDEGDVGAR